MYALVIDGLDGTSGLTGDQGTNFTSTDQLDGDSNTVPMSSGSVYLKAVSDLDYTIECSEQLSYASSYFLLKTSLGENISVESHCDFIPYSTNDNYIWT
ncbi:hypothetical protein DdX_17882 [Ditylenchus destructor]|uniref:Uncharacterized protein n=1 Tax=Ditylenchus destructor TaxID=166010 RepID=A0AAD4QYL5_9BILA|nr:hypothetical protein DdX_17882 [Ditylenchus destructor]